MTNKLTNVWDRVDKEGGPTHAKFGKCWVWTGHTCSKGYGRMSYKRKQCLVHRISYVLTYGVTLSEGQKVLHHCDNPSCVRPDHLFLGTYADNNHDRDGKDRQAKGERNGKSVLTEDQVIEIRESYRKGVKGRGTVVLAKRYHVAVSTIRAVLLGRTWGHIDV